MSTIKVNLVASRNRQDWITTADIRRTRTSLQRVELDGTKVAFYRQLLDHLALLQIPPADDVVVASGHEDIRVVGPNDGLDWALVGAWADLKAFVGRDQGWVRGGGVVLRVAILVVDWCDRGEIENAELVLETARCEEVAVVWWKCNGADDVGVLDGVESLAGVGVPDASVGANISIEQRSQNYATYAVKSAEAVAASDASGERRACQTAPLCPKKVPIQSPVMPSLNIGFPSLQAEMM